jgi:membrane-bound metal-dependent hydrolase YbcI (DUF457 family)
VKATFAVGHLALGYLTGKASGELLKQKINIPLILTVSIIPDIDMLIPGFYHGGPTHSIVLLLAFAFPAILLWKTQTIPYVLALLTHPLIGDYLTRYNTVMGVQLFFPITSNWYSAGSEAYRQLYTYIELALFVVFLIALLATRDIVTLTKPRLSNLLLTIPLLTAALPVFFQFPIRVPPTLIIPHLILIALLTIPIIIDIIHASARSIKVSRSNSS